MKYTLWNNIKFFTGIFLSLLLTIAVFLIGWGMSFTSIDLNKVQQSSGTISSVAVSQSKDSKAVAGQKDLVIHLNGDDTGFWVYRASQNYSSIISQLSTGVNAKIYHSRNTGSNGYSTVYQISTDNGIVYSKDEYESKEKTAGRFIALPGSIAMLIALCIQIRKRYRQPKTVSS